MARWFKFYDQDTTVLENDELAKLFRDLGSEVLDKYSVRDSIIYHNMGLVMSEVNSALNRGVPSWYSREDIVMAGMIGLMNAVDGYDQTSSVKFSTYATTCIRNSINAHLNHENNRSDISLETIKIGEDSHNPVYLKELIVGPNNTDEIALKLSLREAIKELSEREKKVIKLYYGFGCKEHTLVEIAKMMNVTPQDISVIKVRTVKMLRCIIEGKDLSTEDVYINNGRPRTRKYKKYSGGKK